MDQEFREWLAAIVPEERAVLIMDTFEVLSELLNLRVWDVAVNAMSTAAKMDYHVALSDLSSELLQYSHQALLENGIVLNDDITDIDSQVVITKILTALSFVDEWEDCHRILSICQTEDSPEEIFADLCHEIVAVDQEDVLNLLESVDPEKIDILIDHYKSKLGEQIKEEDELTVLSNAARALPKTFFNEWLNEGGAIGLDFLQYVNIFKNELAQTKVANDAASAWILMAIASGLRDRDQIYGEITKAFDQFYRNLEIQSKLGKVVSNMLGGVV